MFEVSDQLHPSAALPPSKSFRYPLYRKMCVPRAGLDDVKILDSTGTRTLTPLSSSPKLVAIPTTLSILLVLSVDGDENGHNRDLFKHAAPYVAK
jgi:hypothetical protein